MSDVFVIEVTIMHDRAMVGDVDDVVDRGDVRVVEAATSYGPIRMAAVSDIASRVES